MNPEQVTDCQYSTGAGSNQHLEASRTKPHVQLARVQERGAIQLQVHSIAPSFQSFPSMFHGRGGGG